MNKAHYEMLTAMLLDTLSVYQNQIADLQAQVAEKDALLEGLTAPDETPVA